MGSKKNSKKNNPRGQARSQPSSKFVKGPAKPNREPERKTKQPPRFLVGAVKRNPDGFGFLLPDDADAPDIYIPKTSMLGIFSYDRVEVEVFRDGQGNRFKEDRYRGEVRRILQRGNKRVVGIYRTVSNRGTLLDEAQTWGVSLQLNNPDNLQVQDGQLIEAEILSYPNDFNGFLGKIVAVLGKPEDPYLDIQRVLIQQNVPNHFSPDTEKEAQTLKPEVRPEQFSQRKDLRSLPLVTIDGATAKDFDDAVCVENNSKGFRLWVAIADVSHYVRPGTPIDLDAYTRGTSVYFPNFVVPMLPEILSNELCSLKPNVPRLALVADMQFDHMGNMQHSEFYEALIQSQARLTYGEAQELVDGKNIEAFAKVKNMILDARDLAKILLQKRKQRGSLELDIPEIQLVIDSEGNPIDVMKSERLFSHRLIEELMLAANVAVAKHLASKQIPVLYRIHDRPQAEALEQLAKYAESFGLKVDFKKGNLQKQLNEILEHFADRDEAQVLHMLTLRSLAQAQYSPNNIGHFGLGFEDYCHFTSPIRRYPDLIVHRVLKSSFQKASGGQRYEEENLQTAGTLLSACEQRAVKAERQVKSIKKARFMEKHLGESFHGIVTSVAKFGVFVLLKEFEVDGLVRLENLAREPLSFDEDHLVLIGRRSGRRIQLGDAMHIRVASVDVQAGQIDFEVVNEGAAQETSWKPQKSWGNKKDHRPNSQGAARNAPAKKKHRGQGRNQEDFGKKKPQGRPQGKIAPAPGKIAAAPGKTPPATDWDAKMEKFGIKNSAQKAERPEADQRRSKKKKSSSGKRGWSIPVSHRK